MSGYKIDSLQFVQEITASVLGLHGINYIHAVGYDKKMEFSNWPAIVYTVMSLFREISKTHESHVLSVVSFISKNGRCQNYIDQLGDRLFGGREFSWKLFRGFLALTAQMSYFSYREDKIILSDDFVTSASVYINSSLQRHIDKQHGWKAFQLDCVWMVLRGKQQEDSPNLTSLTATPSTSGRATLAETVSFNNETIGKVYTSDPEMNVSALDLAPHREIPGQFKAWQKAVDQPCCLVTEIIKISEGVLELMTNGEVTREPHTNVQ